MSPSSCSVTLLLEVLFLVHVKNLGQPLLDTQQQQTAASLSPALQLPGHAETFFLAPRSFIEVNVGDGSRPKSQKATGGQGCISV